MANVSVGINHPYQNFGYDFGVRPRTVADGAGASTSFYPTWKDDIQEVLAAYAMLGFKVVRWFILADGWNIPITFNQQQPIPKSWSFNAKAFASSDTGKAFFTDFRLLLEAFKTFNSSGNFGNGPLLLMPVILDFTFFQYPQIVIGETTTPVMRLLGAPVTKDLVLKPVTSTATAGSFAPQALIEPRYSKDVADITSLVKAYCSYRNVVNPNDGTIFDWTVNIKGGKRSILDNIEDFLAGVVDPLLAIGSQYQDSIYAWEICNEPDSYWKDQPSDSQKLTQLLQQAMKRTLAAKFDVTVGFQVRQTMEAFANDPKTKTIVNAYSNNRFINQFHYYPDKDGQQASVLSAGKFAPLIIGEFAVSGPLFKNEKQPVPDPVQRIKVATGGGAEIALIWSVLGTEEYSHWDSTVSTAIFGLLSPIK